LRLGEPIPERIANAPKLDVYSEFYIRAFNDLSSERNSGFGEGPIPINSIFAYARHYGMNDEEESDLVYFIRVLDKVYLNHQNSKTKK
jgi:hypothetical protein